MDLFYLLGVVAFMLFNLTIAPLLVWKIGYVLYALLHLPLYYLNPKYRKEQ